MHYIMSKGYVLQASEAEEMNLPKVLLEEQVAPGVFLLIACTWVF